MVAHKAELVVGFEAEEELFVRDADGKAADAVFSPPLCGKVSRQGKDWLRRLRLPHVWRGDCLCGAPNQSK